MRVKIFRCRCNKDIETETEIDGWFVAFCSKCYNWKCGFTRRKKNE